MVIIDSSAVMAVLLGEDDALTFARALTARPGRMSVANWLECHLVIDRRAPERRVDLDDLLADLRPTLVDVSVEQARVARQAHLRFGTGSGSPAHLNFGDCFAYALAITTGDTLLFKGDDFTHTDVRPAAGPPAG